MIKNVVFDIGMVLVDFRFREYMQDLGMSPEVIELVTQHMIYHPLWSELDRGEQEFDAVLAQIKKEHPEESAYYDWFWKDPSDVCRPFSETREWLLSVKQQGFQIYLLSNYPKDLFECHWERSFDFTDIPDGRVISYEVKMVKPEPGIYEALFRKYGLKPEESIFLDDRAVNIAAAEKFGMQGIVVQNQRQAREELGKRLLNFGK